MKAARPLRLVDSLSLIGMGTGVALMLQPWWADGFRFGFFVTLACTLLQIMTSHLSAARGTHFQPVREMPSDAG